MYKAGALISTTYISEQKATTVDTYMLLCTLEVTANSDEKLIHIIADLHTWTVWMPGWGATVMDYGLQSNMNKVFITLCVMVYK